MDAGDLVRLAWEADHDGRGRLRDAMLTLAIAESTPSDAWVERCRTRLIADRPDHFFGHFTTVGHALQDPRVLEARDRLRVKYPASRVQSLLLRARAARGPYLGRIESLDAMIEDLAGPMAEADNVRRDAPQPSRGPTQRPKVSRALAEALAFPSMGLETGLEPIPGRVRSKRRTFSQWDDTVNDPPLEDVPVYYLTVLLAIALLLATVQESVDA